MYISGEILGTSIENGQKGIQKPLVAKLILGLIGGAIISLDYLAYVRASASIPVDPVNVQASMGAAVFPIGLIVILMASGKLIIRSMMAVSTAWPAKKVSFKESLANWVTTTLVNMVDTLFVVYFFGHYLGLTSSSAYLNQVLPPAECKVTATWPQAIISGIGRSWFVDLVLQPCYGAEDTARKLLGIWSPVTTFVTVDLQHSVVNVLVIPAAIFEGGVQWEDSFHNSIFVYLGNIIGDAIFISGFYCLSYRRC